MTHVFVSVYCTTLNHKNAQDLNQCSPSSIWPSRCVSVRWNTGATCECINILFDAPTHVYTLCLWTSWRPFVCVWVCRCVCVWVGACLCVCVWVFVCVCECVCVCGAIPYPNFRVAAGFKKRTRNSSMPVPDRKVKRSMAVLCICVCVCYGVCMCVCVCVRMLCLSLWVYIKPITPNGINHLEINWINIIVNIITVNIIDICYSQTRVCRSKVSTCVHSACACTCYGTHTHTHTHSHTHTHTLTRTLTHTHTHTHSHRHCHTHTHTRVMPGAAVWVSVVYICIFLCICR